MSLRPSPPTPATASEEPGVIDIDAPRRQARLNGQRLALGGRAFDLLVALAARPGTHIDAAALQAAVWPGRVVEPGNLRMQVNQLRQRLGTEAIAHLVGRGYRLELPVRRAAVHANLRLIGRDAEARQLEQRVAQERLVTVAGAGGIGKTTLVRDWFDRLPQSPATATAWVDLSGATATQVVPLAAAALGVPSPKPGWTALALAKALPERERVLVLDNAEHLAGAVADLARELLASAPGLRLVLTSQIPLRLPQEHVLRLGPLDLPEPGEAAPAALRHAALRLFVDRVQALDPAFTLEGGALAAAITLCRSLDGLPLAIELAAARVPALGVQALAEALDERLQLLHSPPHSRPQRHQTLRAALEWTHGLLDAGAQAVFARLGVFRGSFTLDDAVAVVADNGEEGPIDRLALIDAIASLADASMLVFEAPQGTPQRRPEAPPAAPAPHGDTPPRYRMLDTPRLYALQRLHETAQHDALRRRHLAWCRTWVTDADEARLRAGQAQLHAALDWALSGGDPAAGKALAQQLIAHKGAAVFAASASASASDAAPGHAEARAGARNDADPAGAGGSGGELHRLLEHLHAAGTVRQARTAGLEHGTVEALARRLLPEEVRSVDGAVHELQAAIEVARSALEESQAGETTADLDVAQALAEVAQHTRGGRFDEGSDRLDEALAELDRREQARREAFLRSRRLLLQGAIQQELLRRDAFAVARRTEELLALDEPAGQPSNLPQAAAPRSPPWHPTQSAAWLERESAAMRNGTASTSLLWLQVAAELARRRLVAARAGGFGAAARLSARRALAAALTALGEHRSGTEALAEAAQVCQDALADLGELAAADAPPGRADAGGPAAGPVPTLEAEWGAVHRAHASALLLLGQRGQDTALLEQALQACEAALKARTRDAAPAEWAAIQHTRGDTLRCLGMLEVGTLRLEQSAQVLGDALLERTAGRAPLDRARTLNILGVTLSIWASREEVPHRHREALAMQQAALALVPGDAEPRLWGALCNNIGIEYNFLGSAGLEPEASWRAAIEAFGRALTVQTRDNAPHLWARLQHNLGVAQAYLGEHLADPALLGQACESFRASLLENTRGRNPQAWASSTNDLGTALMRRGTLTPGATGAALIEEGLRHLQGTLSVRQRETMPNEWLRTQGDVALAQMRLGQHTGEARWVHTAVATASGLLAAPEAAQMPYERANIEQWLGEARQWLHEHGRAAAD